MTKAALIRELDRIGRNLQQCAAEQINAGRNLDAALTLHQAGIGILQTRLALIQAIAEKRARRLNKRR